MKMLYQSTVNTNNKLLLLLLLVEYFTIQHESKLFFDYTNTLVSKGDVFFVNGDFYYLCSTEVTLSRHF